MDEWIIKYIYFIFFTTDHHGYVMPRCLKTSMTYLGRLLLNWPSRLWILTRGRSHGNVCEHADHFPLHVCRHTTETLKTVMKCDILKYTPHSLSRLPVHELIQSDRTRFTHSVSCPALTHDHKHALSHRLHYK